MLGEINWEQQLYASLDFFSSQSSLVGVSHQLTTLTGDLLEDIEDKGVHDVHGFSVDTLGFFGN